MSAKKFKSLDEKRKKKTATGLELEELAKQQLVRQRLKQFEGLAKAASKHPVLDAPDEIFDLSKSLTDPAPCP